MFRAFFQILKPAINLVFLVVIAFSLLGLITSPITNAASISDFSVIDIKCLFEGETKDYAATVNSGSGGAKCTSQESLIGRIIDFLVTLAIPLAIIVIIWGGYQYFLGGFDGKTNGQKAIQSAVIGVTIVLLAQFFVKTVFSGTDPIITAQGQFNANGVISFLGIIRNFLVTIAGAIAVLVIIWGGYKYFFSGLDWDKEDGAKSIRNGVIGLAIVFLASSAFDLSTRVSKDIVAASSATNNTGNALTLAINSIGVPILNNLTDVFLTIASLVAVLTIIYGGYKYFFAGVDIAKEDGLKSIRNGIIGLVAILLARVIVEIVKLVLPATKSGQNGVVVANDQFKFENGQLVGLNIQALINAISVIIGNVLIPASSAFAVFFLVLGAWFWITSNGDEKTLDKARKAIRNSIIGLIILLLSATIVQFVAYIAQNVSLK